MVNHNRSSLSRNMKKLFFSTRISRLTRTRLFRRYVFFWKFSISDNHHHQLEIIALMVNFINIFLVFANHSFFRISTENYFLEGSFREAIWPFLFIGQLFGVLPVIGVRKTRQTSKLRFKWNCFRTIYSLIIAASLSCYALLLIWETFSINIDFSSIGSSYGK